MEASPGEIAALIGVGVAIISTTAGTMWSVLSPRIKALEQLNDAKDKACAAEIALLHASFAARVDELQEKRHAETQAYARALSEQNRDNAATAVENQRLSDRALRLGETLSHLVSRRGK